MGITGLWDVLGEGEVRHIAAYAAEHFQRHKRPLRIAVDEACWRFTNLTPEQVDKIRQNEAAANPVEKVILWRILRLLKLNVQLLSVYDGLHKPGKMRRQGRGGGKLDGSLIKLLHRLFDRLNIPYHCAPGEAEAECALLQRLGIVDAVWSDDGDSFMFGCTTLIKAHKREGKRVADHVRIYTSAATKEAANLDANSLVLFALLSGGDYETAGLRGCGPQLARKLSRIDTGLGSALAHISQAGLPAWRASLQAAIHCEGRDVPVPATFPSWKVLLGYREPAVSTIEQAHNLRALRNGWAEDFDQQKLRTELRQRYNFQTREFLKHITPILLTRALTRVQTPEQRQRNTQLDVRLKATRGKNASHDGENARTEVKLTFSPSALLDGIDLTRMPGDEDWSMFTKSGVPYDPTQPVECELLPCFLDHGLPEGAVQIATPAPRKARAGKTSMSSATSATAANSTDSIGPQPHVWTDSLQRAAPHAGDNQNLRKRDRPRLESPGEQQATSTTIAMSNGEVDLLPRPVFKRLKVPDFNAKTTQRLGVGSGGDGVKPLGTTHSESRIYPDAQAAANRSPANQAVPVSVHTTPVAESPTTPVGLKIARSDPANKSSAIGLQPGEIITPETLRRLRMAGLSGQIAHGPKSTRPARRSGSKTLPLSPDAVIIDLT